MNAPSWRRLIIAVSLCLFVGRRTQLASSSPVLRSASTMTPAIVKRQLSNGLRRLDRRAARAAGRANEPARAGRHRRRPARPLSGPRASRRRCSPRAPARDRPSRSPTRSTPCWPISPRRATSIPPRFNCTCRSARLAEALPLMADVAQRPTFPMQELETLRQERLITLRNARSDPDAIAALAFARGSYGTSHRSAAPLIGTTESLQALTAEDLRAFHAAAYRPGNSTLIVVGDVTPDQVLPLLETHFGKWQAASVSRAAEPAPRRSDDDAPGDPHRHAGRAAVENSSWAAWAGRTRMLEFFPMQVLTSIVRDRLSSDRNSRCATTRRACDRASTCASRRRRSWSSPPRRWTRLPNLSSVMLSELGGMVKAVPAGRARAREGQRRASTFRRRSQRRGAFRVDCERWNRCSSTACPTTITPTPWQRFKPSPRATSSVWREQYIDPDRLTIVIVGDRRAVEPSIRASESRTRSRR